MKKKKVSPPRRSVTPKKASKKIAPKKVRPTPKKAAPVKKPVVEKGREVKVTASTAQHRVESRTVEAVVPVVAPTEPQRAPVRKIIRDGRAVVVVPTAAPRVVDFSEELRLAAERFGSVAGSGSIQSRRFVEFWVGEGAIPAALDRPCGELERCSFIDIVGAEEPATIRAVIESLHRAATAAVEPPPEAEQRRALKASVPLEPTWQSNKPNYPAQVRAFLGLVEWQCRLAGAWPFAFARFMSKIPQRMGSDEFVALAYSLDRPIAEVGESLGWGADEVVVLAERGREQLVGVFDSECSDVHRQWNIALRGTGVSVDQLVQRYLVDSLSREFQLLLGQMTARAMVATFSAEGLGGVSPGVMSAVA